MLRIVLYVLAKFHFITGAKFRSILAERYLVFENLDFDNPTNFVINDEEM